MNTKLLLTLACVGLAAHGLRAQGTEFTYQGRLDTAQAPAEGLYDFTFRLYDDSGGDLQVGPTLNPTAVPVSNGLFTVLLDFGAVWDGAARWLQIGVRSNGVGSYLDLSPRQKVTPSPYAIFAGAAPLADNAVTTAKIADGAILTDDLANNSVTSPKILDGTILTADLANNSVTSAKVLDGSLQGADLANNTVTSTQLADSIALGNSNILGRLDVFFANTASNQPAIVLDGADNSIRTYGSDGAEQIRLWGVSYGEIQLFDSSTANNLAALLSANGTSGGALRLYRGGTNQTGASVTAGTTTGGRTLLYSGANQTAVDLRAQFSAAFPGAWMGLYHTNQERITFAAQNGTSGRGGLIDIKNNSTLNTIRLTGDSGSGDSVFEMYAGGTNRSFRVFANDSAAGAALYLYNGVGSERVEIDSDDGDNGAIIRLRNSSGATTITLDADLSGDGRITTQELQITGGSDLSEQFDINPGAAELLPGTIVCIDPAHPGELRPSSRAYDTTVAGVVSGAGGVKPGMLMGQAGTKADGQHPVALTGRVYALADASHGAIKPGDLLTTSDTAGHAMKVGEPAKAQGAILGKAMTALESGKGLVLVLVSLQ